MTASATSAASRASTTPRSWASAWPSATVPHPEPVRRPEVPRPGNKYAWLVGILAVMGLSVLLFTTTLPNSGEGLRGPEPGSRLKAFAAPSALGDLEGESNVCQRKKDCNKTNGNIAGLRGARRGSGQRLRPAPAAADPHLRVRPRRRLPAAGGPHRAGARRSARSGLRHRLLQPQGSRRAPAHRARAGAGSSRWRWTTAPWRTSTEWAAARPPSSRARAARSLETKLGNLTEGELRAEARRLVR